MNDVKMVRLGDVCEQISGEWGTDCTEKDVGTNILRTTNFTNIGEINYENVVKRSIPENKVATKKLHKNDIILEKSGGSDTQPVGRVVFFDRDDETFLCNNFTTILRISDSSIYSKYVFDYLFYSHSIGITKYYQNQTTGIHNLRTKEYLERKIPLPPLETQKQIASRLDLCADTIAKHKKLLELHETLIKSQFVKMFGDPVTNPMGWEVKPIQEVAPIQQAEKNCSEKVWLLNLDMIESQTGEIIDYLIIDKNKVGNSTYYFDEKNVLYSKLRPYLNKVVIPEKKGICTSELVPLKPTSILNRYFLANLLRSKSFVSYINEKTEGSKMPRVSMKIFRDFSCILPPLPLQQKFATFVQQVEKSKQSVQTSLQKAETLYKALMQKYFG